MGVNRSKHRSRSRGAAEEFKADAVEIVRTSDMPVSPVARELGIGHLIGERLNQGWNPHQDAL